MGKRLRSRQGREEPTTGRRCRSIPQPVWFISRRRRTAPAPLHSIQTLLTSRENGTSASFAAIAPPVLVWNRLRNLRRRFLLLRPSDRFHPKVSAECSWHGIRLPSKNAGELRAAGASEAGR